MNIIILADYGFAKGGAERVAVAAALGLARRGNAVTYLCAVGPVAEELIGEPNLAVRCLNQNDLLSGGMANAAKQGIWNRAAAAAMRQLLAHHDPQSVIVHAHTWTHALTSSPLAVAVKAHVSTVVTLHDYFLACPNGGFYDFQRGEICTRQPLGWSCLCTNCDARGAGHKAFRVARQLVQRDWSGLPKRLRNFIDLSDFSRDILRPHLPSQAQFTRISNPILVEPCDPAEPERRRGFVFIGRLVPEKAPQLLARAAAALNVPVTFIGEGPLRDELARLNPAARFTGWLGHADLQRELRASRALVFPSVWYETQGLVVLEALANGVPALVADRCAAKEFVEPDQTGLWFQSGNENDLIRRLAELADDALVARLGRAAHERFWADPPTLERHLDQLEALYERMAAPRARPDLAFAGA